jgi:hypothetical protein
MEEEDVVSRRTKGVVVVVVTRAAGSELSGWVNGWVGVGDLFVLVTREGLVGVGQGGEMLTTNDKKGSSEERLSMM